MREDRKWLECRLLFDNLTLINDAPAFTLELDQDDCVFLGIASMKTELDFYFINANGNRVPILGYFVGFDIAAKSAKLLLSFQSINRTEIKLAGNNYYTIIIQNTNEWRR